MFTFVSGGGFPFNGSRMLMKECRVRLRFVFNVLVELIRMLGGEFSRSI